MEEYVTVRIPEFFDKYVQQYLKKHEFDMRLRGLRASRSGVVKMALLEFFEKDGLIKR